MPAMIVNLSLSKDVLVSCLLVNINFPPLKNNGNGEGKAFTICPVYLPLNFLKFFGELNPIWVSKLNSYQSYDSPGKYTFLLVSSASTIGVAIR